VSRVTFRVDSPTEAQVSVEILAAVAAHEDGRREDPAQIVSFGADPEPAPVAEGQTSLRATVESGATYVVDADFDERLATAVEIRVLTETEVQP
jgi:hypothetical protein